MVGWLAAYREAQVDRGKQSCPRREVDTWKSGKTMGVGEAEGANVNTERRLRDIEHRLTAIEKMLTRYCQECGGNGRDPVFRAISDDGIVTTYPCKACGGTGKERT